MKLAFIICQFLVLSVSFQTVSALPGGTWASSPTTDEQGKRIRHSSAPLFNRDVLVVGGEYVSVTSFPVTQTSADAIAIYRAGTGWVPPDRIQTDSAASELAFVGHTLKPLREGNFSQTFDADSSWPIGSLVQQFVLFGGDAGNQNSMLLNSNRTNVHFIQVLWDSSSDIYHIDYTPGTRSLNYHPNYLDGEADNVRDSAIITFDNFFVSFGGFAPNRTQDECGRCPSMDELIAIPYDVTNNNDFNLPVVLPQIPLHNNLLPHARSGHSLDMVSHEYTFAPLTPDDIAKNKTVGEPMTISTALLFGGVRYNYAQENPKHAKVEYLGDLWMLQVETPTHASNSNLILSATWTRLLSGYEVGATQPPSRSYHRSFVKDGKLYIYGGLNIVDTQQHIIEIFEDLWVFDPETSSWEELSSVGAIPQARAHHSMCYIQSTDSAVVVGGMIQQPSGNGAVIAVTLPQVHELEF